MRCLTTDVGVTWYGGANRVSGSLAVLETPTGRWMIDCGEFYPEGEGTKDSRIQAAAEASCSLPPEALSVDGVLVTHAHLDHIGRLPLLVRSGYHGPIYMTEASALIVPVMLRMSLQYDDACTRRWIWSKRASYHGPLLFSPPPVRRLRLPPYTKTDRIGVGSGEMWVMWHPLSRRRGYGGLVWSIPRDPRSC